MDRTRILRHFLAAVFFAMVLLAGANNRIWAADIADISDLDFYGGKVYTLDEDAYTGWYSDGKYDYYSHKGKRIKGWKKISGKYYYFGKKYRLEKNTIAGTKKTGYYYVDESGIRVSTKEMNMAVKFVLKNSDRSSSAKKRLEQCYAALRKYPYKRIIGDKPSADSVPGYAGYMFKNKCGNCYRYGSAMAYIAAALGYQVRVAAGGVTARGPRHPLSPHGWCEVKMDSSWKMCDVSMHNGHPGRKMYLVTRKEYPFRLRCDNVYTMKIEDGKIIWK